MIVLFAVCVSVCFMPGLLRGMQRARQEYEVEEGKTEDDAATFREWNRLRLHRIRHLRSPAEIDAANQQRRLNDAEYRSQLSPADNIELKKNRRLNYHGLNVANGEAFLDIPDIPEGGERGAAIAECARLHI
jgi:hypothetical protein